MASAATPRQARLDLLYLLARHPQATTTFVNGEVREMAALVTRVGILAMSRTGEADARPGGIPPSVQVDWAPAVGSRLLSGTMTVLARRAGGYAGELGRLLKAAGPRPRPYLRAAVTVAQAAAAAAKLAEPLAPRHLHAHFAGRGALAAHVASRLLEVPYSMTVHAYDIFTPNPHLPLLVRDAILTVAISEYDRDEVLRLVPDADPERVRTIHVGVPSAELATLAEAHSRRRGGKTRNDALIVSVGNLIPKKGMDVLLEAVSRLLKGGRAVRCEIVGDGEQRPALERRATQLGLGRAVRFRGQLSPEEARRRIAAADLFVLACRPGPRGDLDGIPVVLMEAMACARPTVSTSLSGIPELIADRRRGRLAEPGDPDSLAAAMAELMDRPEVAARWAAAGQRFVQRHFDQAANARRLLTAILEARREPT